MFYFFDYREIVVIVKTQTHNCDFVFSVEIFMLKSPEPNKIDLKISFYVHDAAVALLRAKATRQALFKCSKNLYLKTEYLHEKLILNFFK